MAFAAVPHACCVIEVAAKGQLVGIVPGYEGREAKSLNPFQECVVDELLQFTGSTIYDAYKSAPFTAKASMLMHVLD